MTAPLPNAFLALVILAPTPAFADAPTDKQKQLDATLRKLEKDIAEVRGLAFKEPVVAKIIPRPRDKDKGVQGYYSLKDKALFIYDDIKGSYERGVLVHEMVHALQDQHFGLKNLHPTGFDSDADLARAALIEGDATYTMIELLKKDQPHVLAMLDTNLETAKNLQNAFLYGQGARYVKALKEKGGWEAVNAAYKNPPRYTAQVLHPGERISVVDLGPGKRLGEYELLSRLRVHTDRVTRSETLAADWRGDCFIQEDRGSVWRLAFADDAAASECYYDFAIAFAEKHHGGVPVLRGSRVIVYTARDDAALAQLKERYGGPLDLKVYSARENRPITFGELTDRLLESDVVCIGETHDSDLHHRVQLQIIQSLHARDPRLGVGMEMFQRPFQSRLDDYLAGQIKSEQRFLKTTEYPTRWGFEWSMYRPIVDFCRANGVPVAALNVSTELKNRISKVGHAALTDAEKKELGDIDFHVKAHRDHWYDLLAQMHGKDATAEQKERSYQVMTVWDEYMADSAARFQKERGIRRMVILAGSGHIERGFGIPERLAKRTGGKTATIKIEVGGDMEKLTKEPTTDYIIIVR
jgi:uncharacterized iron-regulated protein